MRHRPAVILHEQNAVLGRANRFLAQRADRLALSFADTQRVPAGMRRRSSPAIRCGRRSPRWRRRVTRRRPRTCGCWCWAARSARACSATWCRRRWRRCRDALRARLLVTQQCRAEDLDRVRAAYDAVRHQRRAGAVLPRCADAAGGGASGDRARRRLDRRGTRGRRTAGDPGAAARRDRRPSDGQCARAGRGRRRLGDAAAGFHARCAGRAADRTVRRPGRAGACRRGSAQHGAARRGRASGRSGRSR